MKIAPFSLERFFAKYEFKAPYLLSSSDCESFTIQTILDLEPGSRNFRVGFGRATLPEAIARFEEYLRDCL